jgi:hypothetical protein
LHEKTLKEILVKCQLRAPAERRAVQGAEHHIKYGDKYFLFDPATPAVLVFMTIFIRGTCAVLGGLRIVLKLRRFGAKIPAS